MALPDIMSMGDYIKFMHGSKDAQYTFTRGNHDNPVTQEDTMKQDITIKYETVKRTVEFGQLSVGQFFQWGNKLYIKGPGYSDNSKGRGIRVGREYGSADGDTINFGYNTAVIKPHVVKLRVINESCDSQQYMEVG